MLREHCSPIHEKFRMNFVRSRCDVRAMQSLMQEDAFSLRVRNELLAAAMWTRWCWFEFDGVASDAMSRSFGAAQMVDSQGTAIVQFVRRAIGPTEDPTLVNEDWFSAT
jgi:hypothetical protein